MGFTLNQLEQERQIRKLQKKEDKDTKDYEQLSNLPKINNVELKGDKTTSDLGINATNVMLSDGVTSVEDRLDAHDLTNRVTIASYTASNKYTCPSDGYIFVYNTSSADGYIAIDELASIGANAGRFSAFVRKGTLVWVEGTVTSAYFSSLQ